MGNNELDQFIIILSVLLQVIAALIVWINFTAYRRALEQVCLFHLKTADSVRVQTTCCALITRCAQRRSIRNSIAVRQAHLPPKKKKFSITSFMHEEYNVDLTGQMPQVVPKRKQYARQQSLSFEILV